MCASRKLTLLSFVTPCFQRLPTIFHAIAAAIDGDNLSMMKQPVEQCCGKNLVSQEATPLGKPRVGGKPDRAVLIASGDELKEMMRLSGRKLGIAHLVDHENTRGGIATQPLANQARIGSGVQRLGQVGQGGKQSRIARSPRLDRERQAEVCFPNPWRSQEDDVGRGLDKREISQFPQQSFAEAGLKGKIKRLQGFDRR